jgi:DNA-binding CsgD family transcriptional regulator
VHRICERLDGIPLAIELAAATVAFLTPQQVLERMEVGSRFLDSVHRPDSRRQHTMAAAIRRSYELLVDTERRLFAELSVFVGGFDLEAAEAVCGTAGTPPTLILDLVSSLVAKSLVVAEPTPGGTMRYRLLEPLRQFAMDALQASTEAARMREAHAMYYFAMARQSNLAVVDGAGGRWWPVLSREHDNLYAALGWMLERQDAMGAQIVATAVGEVWRIRGHIGEARALLARVMMVADHASSVTARAGLLLLGGQLAYFQGEFAAGRALLEESVSLAGQAQLAPGLARALVRLADVERAQGNYANARGLVDAAVAACPVSEHDSGLRASIHARRTLIDLDQMEYDSAKALAEELLPSVQRGGWSRVEAEVLTVLAVCSSFRGQHAEALKLLEESLARWHASDRWGCARALVELARVAVAAGDDTRASTFVASSLTICRELGDPWGAAAAIDVSAALASRAGRHDRAVHLAEASDAIRDAAQIVQSPRERAWLNEQMKSVLRILGTKRYALARHAGRTLTFGQALELAFRREASDPASGLTQREQEVVRQLAATRTNREIADELVIAVPTVERHVANILNKLQLRSRAQVAVWAVDHHMRDTRP